MRRGSHPGRGDRQVGTGPGGGRSRPGLRTGIRAATGGRVPPRGRGVGRAGRCPDGLAGRIVGPRALVDVGFRARGLGRVRGAAGWPRPCRAAGTCLVLGPVLAGIGIFLRVERPVRAARGAVPAGAAPIGLERPVHAVVRGGAEGRLLRRTVGAATRSTARRAGIQYPGLPRRCHPSGSLPIPPRPIRAGSHRRRLASASTTTPGRPRGRASRSSSLVRPRRHPAIDSPTPTGRPDRPRRVAPDCRTPGASRRRGPGRRPTDDAARPPASGRSSTPCPRPAARRRPGSRGTSARPRRRRHRGGSPWPALDRRA